MSHTPQENSGGVTRVDFFIYCISFMSYSFAHLATMNNILETFCKIAAFIGFTFTALNQGRKFFQKDDSGSKNKRNME